MKNRLNTEIKIVTEDIIDVVVNLNDSEVNQTDYYWCLAEYLLSENNDIEVTVSEELLSIKFRDLPPDLKRIESSIYGFQFNFHEVIKSTLEIPICYEEKFAIDLKRISNLLKLSTKEIISRHSSVAYEVKAIGFIPGFAYLGDLDQEISVPRLETPRIETPIGSVAIANNRSGIYCLGGPGGWPIIGATPITLFRSEESNPIKLIPGMKISFKQIDQEEFKFIQAQN